MDHHQKHLQEHPKLNKAFMQEEKMDLHYSIAATKVQYPMYHEYLTDNKVELSADYLDFAKDLNLNDENMKGNGTYAQFVNGYLRLLAYQQLSAEGKDVSAYDSSPEMMNAEYHLIEKMITDEKERSTMQYRGLLTYLSSKDAVGIDDLVKKYMNSTDSENRKKRLQASYESAKRLATCQPAPSFSYPDIEGTDMSLASFKGRYVYIDMWATWCGPCMRDLPHLEELQEKYKNDSNVAFVSISIDNDKDAWRKMVTEKQMKGFQLIADQAWQSQICADYGVNGIPRFVLIDREGNLINKNAPRPSSDELKAILNNLLSEDRSSK
ncbi:MAG: TlpA disulfide reductase family protein, partial [Bacteroidota bacterium]